MLTSAAVGTSTLTVAGTLNAAASKTYRLEFFASPGPDPSGHGQGKMNLGTASVTTDGTGNFIFSGFTTGTAGNETAAKGATLFEAGASSITVRSGCGAAT